MQNWGPVRFPDYTVGQYAQPKQRFSFVVLYQLPLGFTNVENGGIKDGAIMGALNRDQYPQVSAISSDQTKDLSTLLTMATKNFPALNWGVTPQTDTAFFNGQLHWAGKREYTPTLAINFREYVTSPIGRILLNWQKLQNDPVTNNIGYANKYKGVIVKLDLDPNVFHEGTEMLDIEKLITKHKKATQTGLGTDGDSDLENIITRQVVCEGCWPSSISEPDGDYTDTGTLQDVTQTFQTDRYYEDKDWQRFIDEDTLTAQQLVQSS